MGTRYVDLRTRINWKQMKVERKDSSSNRPELAAFVVALRHKLEPKPMLYLCDNQALLTAVKK